VIVAIGTSTHAVVLVPVNVLLCVLVCEYVHIERVRVNERDFERNVSEEISVMMKSLSVEDVTPVCVCVCVCDV